MANLARDGEGVTPAANGSVGTLVLASTTAEPCGVEAFARRLAEALGPSAALHPLSMDLPGLARALRGRAALMINLPIVAWKRRLIAPTLAALTARLMGREVAIVAHEWADLDWKRRVSYAPLLLLASSMTFSAPEIADQFARSPLSRFTTRRRTLTPIPPNLARPPVVVRRPECDQIEAARGQGRLILAQFGSIYPRKQSTVVLDIAVRLRAMGENPFVTFIGSFIAGGDRTEVDFSNRVTALGLENDVLVTGYIATEAELFGLFEAVDVFAYSFTEGLTSRRGSVLAAAASGRPVLVNAPTSPRAFAHHPTYARLIAGGVLRLLPHDADPEDFARAAAVARDTPTVPNPIDAAAAWRDAADAARAATA